jgi:hypothetical protein
LLGGASQDRQHPRHGCQSGRRFADPRPFLRGPAVLVDPAAAPCGVGLGDGNAFWRQPQKLCAAAPSKARPHTPGIARPRGENRLILAVPLLVLQDLHGIAGVVGQRDGVFVARLAQRILGKTQYQRCRLQLSQTAVCGNVAQRIGAGGNGWSNALSRMLPPPQPHLRHAFWGALRLQFGLVNEHLGFQLNPLAPDRLRVIMQRKLFPCGLGVPVRSGGAGKAAMGGRAVAGRPLLLKPHAYSAAMPHTTEKTSTASRPLKPRFRPFAIAPSPGRPGLLRSFRSSSAASAAPARASASPSTADLRAVPPICGVERKLGRGISQALPFPAALVGCRPAATPAVRPCLPSRAPAECSAPAGRPNSRRASLPRVGAAQAAHGDKFPAAQFSPARPESAGFSSVRSSPAASSLPRACEVQVRIYPSGRQNLPSPACGARLGALGPEARMTPSPAHVWSVAQTRGAGPTACALSRVCSPWAHEGPRVSASPLPRPPPPSAGVLAWSRRASPTVSRACGARVVPLHPGRR